MNKEKLCKFLKIVSLLAILTCLIKYFYDKNADNLDDGIDEEDEDDYYDFYDDDYDLDFFSEHD